MSQKRKRCRTECDAKVGSGSVEIVLELVVEGTEDGNDKMEQDPDSDKELPASLVDHPKIELLFIRLCVIGLGSRVCEGTLQSLEPPALSFVALEMTWGGAAVNGKVRMEMRIRSTVREIHDSLKAKRPA